MSDQILAAANRLRERRQHAVCFLGAAILTVAIAGCSKQEDPYRGMSARPAGEIAWSLPEREVFSPVNVAEAPELVHARDLLRTVVNERARDPYNPWAVAHAILALGPEVELTNGEKAVDFLFSEYAEVVKVGGENLIGFPLETTRTVVDPETGAKKTLEIRVEPHPELVLKTLAGGGLSPHRTVTVAGDTFTLAHLYHHSLIRAWAGGNELGHRHWDNVPWGLQALATWAPKGLAWIAQDGRRMTLDWYTHAAVVKLREETKVIRAELGAEGDILSHSGLDGYSCGGAHFVQGTGYALARGFGTDQDRAAFAEEIELLLWSFEDRRTKLRAAIQQHPEDRFFLMVQLFKFTGHFVESIHKFAALELFVPTEEQKLVMVQAVGEVIANVLVMEQMGVFRQLDDIQKENEQAYLDVVGDSAHALHAIQLATAEASVKY